MGWYSVLPLDLLSVFFDIFRDAVYYFAHDFSHF